MVATITKQILLIDDEATHRIFAMRGINKYSTSLKVQECASATEAIEHIKKNIVYDLIIVDLKLDYESGLDVIRFVRTSDVYTPIIVVSTSDLPTHINESYQLGANCYITKGTDPLSYSQNIYQSLKFYLR